MEWTDIRLTVAKADADNAEAVATMIAEGGIYIEDYSDIEQQVAEIAHVDLIEQELLDKPRDTVIIHMYLEPGASPVETLALIQARMEAAGIAYTVETEGVEQEDWQNGWRKYYHPMDIGKRLAIVPSWQEYDTDRVKLILDPGLAFGTGGHETTSLCLEALDEQVRGGERIALIGDNGTGKSTLIKMLMEEEYPDEGKIKFGPSVRIAYLPQIVEFDVPERNLVDTMLYSKRNITPQSARNRLAAFHFTGEDVFKSVSVLSGGELSRLKLCILMDEEVNLLILDEPTNHLDIASREWIEEAVESYDGTLLFVSHDRYFINRFATRVWELENGVITDYPMGFARYRQVKALEAQNKIDHTPKAVKEKTVTEKPKPNRSAQQARRQLTICEKEISAQETAIAEIEQRLEEAGGDYERYSEIYKEKEAAEQMLSELMEKWETLAEQAGE